MTPKIQIVIIKYYTTRLDIMANTMTTLILALVAAITTLADPTVAETLAVNLVDWFKKNKIVK